MRFAIIKRTLSTLKLLDRRQDPKFPINDLTIIESFISEQEELDLIKYLNRKLRRLPYETNHFDHVITNYREMQISEWPKEFEHIRHRMISATGLNEPSSINWKPFHALDLGDRGSIGKHVDHIEYSGRVISGLCLLSQAVVRFRAKDQPDHYADVLLPQKCFYVQRDSLRYDYTHEIIADTNGNYNFMGSTFKRSRRLCLLLRDDIKQQ